MSKITTTIEMTTESKDYFLKYEGDGIVVIDNYKQSGGRYLLSVDDLPEIIAFLKEAVNDTE